MKFLFTLLLVATFIFTSAQVNKDSIFIFLLDESKDATIRLEAFRQYVINDSLYSNVDSAIQLAKMRIDLVKRKEIREPHFMNRNLGFFFLGLFSMTILAFVLYTKDQKNKNLAEREKLLQQIESLNKKLTAQSVANPVSDKKPLTLDKGKIEKAINSKLGESSWMILNLIFTNPSISNKEIAEEVSLSIEGVSSSLRRMYQAFEITNSSNKKITLIMKATRLSFEN